MNNFKKIITVIFLILSSKAESQIDLLEKAYKKESTILLDSFITNWVREMPGITDGELYLKNDTIKAVYELFNLNFDPHNILKLTDSTDHAYYDSIYKNIRFAIVPNKIKYSIVDEFLSDTWLTNPRFKKFFENSNDTGRTISFLENVYGSDDLTIFRDSINYFREKTKNEIKLLYLNSRYESILTKFIFNSSRGDFLAGFNKRKDKEIKKRAEFLNKRFPIQNPFSVPWNLFTNPRIIFVAFNKNFQKAKVWYYIDCVLWVAIFENGNGEWKYLEHLYKGCWCG